MADNHSKETRSKNMSHIRSKNTKPEEKLESFFFQKDFVIEKMLKHFRGVLTLCSQSIKP